MKNQDKIIENSIEVNDYLEKLDVEMYTEHYSDIVYNYLTLESYEKAESQYQDQIAELVARYGEDRALAVLIECTTTGYNDSTYTYSGTIEYFSIGELEVCLGFFGYFDPELVDFCCDDDYAYINTDAHWYAELDHCVFESRMREMLELPEGVERLQPNYRRSYWDEDGTVLSFQTGERVA